MTRAISICAALALSGCGGADVSVRHDVWLCAVPGVTVPVTVPGLDGLPVRLVALSATVEASGLRVDVGCARQVQAAAVAGPATVAPDLGGGAP